MGFLAIHIAQPRAAYTCKKTFVFHKYDISNGPVTTTSDFLNARSHTMVCGGKIYQHILFTLYGGAKFSRTDVQSAYPNIIIEGEQQFYTLSDIFNIVGDLNYKRRSCLQKAKLQF
jgi:hypothetical protein